MKAEDLKGKTVDELNKMVTDLKKEQFNLRFQRSGGQLENTSAMRNVRRDVARVKTAMNKDKAAPAKATKQKQKKKSA